MTSDQVAQAQPREPLEAFWFAVRLTSIALGIGSAALMAEKASSLSFNRDFLEFLIVVENFVGVIVLPLEIGIVKPSIAWLHDHGLGIDLQPHWKSAFVLLWLVLGNQARVGDRLFRQLAWAGCCAFFGAIGAGASPLNSIGVFLWPVAAVAVWLAADVAATWGPARHLGFGSTVMSVAAFFAFALLLFIPSIAALSVGYRLIPSPSPGLVSLAALTAIYGLINLLLSGANFLTFKTMASDPDSEQFGLANARKAFNMGANILAVLGGALFLVWLGHMLA
jgi:hypothetical protein